MSQKENPYEYLFLDEEIIDIREQVEKYSYHWKWFVLGVCIALAGAFMYLRYTPNSYEVSATILIDDEKNGGLPSELAAFEELGLMGGAQKKVENEIGLLKSRSLMERVVKELGINITYYTHGRVRSAEVHKNKLPLKITFLAKDSLFYQQDTAFYLKTISHTHFSISDADKSQTNLHLFGENISTKFGEFIVTPYDPNLIDTEQELLIILSPLQYVAEAIRENIQIELLYKKSSLIELVLELPIKLKGQEILNELIRQYNNDAVDYKSLVGKNTDVFINERLEVIEKELTRIDNDVEEFKSSNKLTDIPGEATLILENNSEIEKQIIQLNTQLKLVDYITAYINDNSEQLIPSNVGLTDSNVNSNTTRYNELLLERNRISKSSGKKNPIIINLNAQLKQLRVSISQALLNHKTSLQITLDQAMLQERRLSVRIMSAPGKERDFRHIQRQQQIIEGLYLFLLEKREENAISLAVTVPNAKIIDAADGSNIPISPKRKMVYLLALIVGLLFPFIVLYLRFLLDNKVHTRKEIEAIVKAPFLGDIPKTDLKEKLISENDRNNLAEAFRMVRTNISFMLGKGTKGAKTIFVTSTISHEGKTFIAINLALVLALSNKKVLLVGADIRKPKVAEYLNRPTLKKGLTLFLTDASIKIYEIIEHVDTSNFDVIQSGVIAPNPSELLMNGRFEEVLNYGKEHYDYIVVDTSPINMVTDTLQLAQFSDLFIYVVRANYLDKRLLEIPQKLYSEKRIANMAMIMNDSDGKKGYGYGYGYGYGNEGEKPWWEKLISKS